MIILFYEQINPNNKSPCIIIRNKKKPIILDIGEKLLQGIILPNLP